MRKNEINSIVFMVLCNKHTFIKNDYMEEKDDRFKELWFYRKI